jgi:hypothetical protein
LILDDGQPTAFTVEFLSGEPEGGLLTRLELGTLCREAAREVAKRWGH